MEPPSPKFAPQREARVVEKSCCERLLHRIFQIWEQVHFFYEQLSLDLYLNQRGFFEISARCCEKMNRDGDHRQVLLEWVEGMYQLHGCDRVRAVWNEARQADGWINPILVKELERMAPHYPAAQVLLTTARLEKRPLIELLRA